MTKEQATERLQILKKEWDRHIYDLGNAVALDMAIKALEQQASDDCVSRADARSLIAESFRKKLLGITFNKMFETLYKGIDELPPVTPTQRCVVERSKIDKAIEEINDIPVLFCDFPLGKTQVVRKDVVLAILKRNLGE